MKHNLTKAILIAGIALSCNTAKKSTNNISIDSAGISTINKTIADGKSFDTAILIQEKNETAGVHAEYKWIRDHYSGYKVLGQSLKSNGKKPYDVISIEFDDGDRRDVYFDISEFFGHL